ncbi:MAG: ABC transporter ATP-binding protein, partial [Thermosphaera sp.]
VKHLSGGNQQKVMTGRELVKNPKLLVAMEPTQGLDVKSTQQIRRLLLDHRNKGGAVLLISSDLEELLTLSDRLVIMFNGRITAEGTPGGLTVEKIGLCMGGSC